MDHESKPIQDPSSGPSGPAAKLRNLFFVSLALLVVLNLFILPHHPHFGLEKIPGFWALFGLVGTIVLARLAKGAAHTFLGKDEDYYRKKD
jgi:hypothetical protein